MFIHALGHALFMTCDQLKTCSYVKINVLISKNAGKANECTFYPRASCSGLPKAQWIVGVSGLEFAGNQMRLILGASRRRGIDERKGSCNSIA